MRNLPAHQMKSGGHRIIDDGATTNLPLKLEYDMREEKIERLLNAVQEKMASCLAVLER